MTENIDKTGELLKAILTASEDRKDQALRFLRGEIETPKPLTGPLLLGMGAGAQFLGVSRATLWRILRAGTIKRVDHPSL